MKDETKEILDSLLGEWHRWSKGFQVVAGHGTSAMFTGVRSSRQWDSEHDVVDGALHNEQMKAVDFHIGELCDNFRTALGINARNIVTGKSVWSSPRLPENQKDRCELLANARFELVIRLRSAGII
jgi:hypothetical protein